MKIISIRPAPPGGNTLARFDAELAPGIRAYGLRLVQAQAGLRVFGASIAGGSSVTFVPEVAARLAQLAQGEIARDDRAKETA
ncbi:hypothetical protein [Ciceribacter selenitireducens]